MMCGNGWVLVDLKDFKSFRRMLKPSGVGSIPTHSRHFISEEEREAAEGHSLST